MVLLDLHDVAGGHPECAFRSSTVDTYGKPETVQNVQALASQSGGWRTPKRSTRWKRHRVALVERGDLEVNNPDGRTSVARHHQAEMAGTGTYHSGAIGGQRIFWSSIPRAAVIESTVFIKATAKRDFAFTAGFYLPAAKVAVTAAKEPLRGIGLLKKTRWLRFRKPARRLLLVESARKNDGNCRVNLLHREERFFALQNTGIIRSSNTMERVRRGVCETAPRPRACFPLAWIRPCLRCRARFWREA